MIEPTGRRIILDSVASLQALASRIGEEVAVSDWLEVTQSRINAFAEATGDDQWIHVDPLRAARSPLGTTIAHGFLTLSLVSLLVRTTIAFPPLKMAINYGLNRVRFVGPVASGARIRARIAPAAVEEAGGGLQITWDVTMECEGAEKPCAVVQWIVRYYH
jgi:acyl dehydratase